MRSDALLRLIACAESHPLLKNAIGKTRVRVFLLLHYFSLTKKEKLTKRKTGTPVFPIAFFQPACDSCGGDKPEQSTQAQEKCDSWEFAEIRGLFFLCFRT
ncbi:hypothetical protein Mlab_1698 [Methanocorpusculum labreanum Z]|uniref:Uncharacterized protein n=1 Tax=Methanocorpusculum labreanum (strain ATCC 43576 / DSM 4855 / Z) TaxID=410358 RepID=A2SU53_METLZ|nr:hypothetical protein Mlab_1698 [Methanocorpusculum labreanum Z]